MLTTYTRCKCHVCASKHLEISPTEAVNLARCCTYVSRTVRALIVAPSNCARAAVSSAVVCSNCSLSAYTCMCVCKCACGCRMYQSVWTMSPSGCMHLTQRNDCTARDVCISRNMTSHMRSDTYSTMRTTSDVSVCCCDAPSSCAVRPITLCCSRIARFSNI